MENRPYIVKLIESTKLISVLTSDLNTIPCLQHITTMDNDNEDFNGFCKRILGDAEIMMAGGFVSWIFGEKYLFRDVDFFIPYNKNFNKHLELEDERIKVIQSIKKIENPPYEDLPGYFTRPKSNIYRYKIDHDKYFYVDPSLKEKVFVDNLAFDIVFVKVSKYCINTEEGFLDIIRNFDRHYLRYAIYQKNLIYKKINCNGLSRNMGGIYNDKILISLGISMFQDLYNFFLFQPGLLGAVKWQHFIKIYNSFKEKITNLMIRNTKQLSDSLIYRKKHQPPSLLNLSYHVFSGMKEGVIQDVPALINDFYGECISNVDQCFSNINFEKLHDNLRYYHNKYCSKLLIKDCNCCWNNLLIYCPDIPKVNLFRIKFKRKFSQID